VEHEPEREREEDDDADRGTVRDVIFDCTNRKNWRPEDLQTVSPRPYTGGNLERR
jgi:hypothetical protein